MVSVTTALHCLCCRGFESVDMVIIIAYNNIYAGSKTFADVNV